MNELERSEDTAQKLLKHRFPNQIFLDDICFALSRAKGMIGLIGDVACFAQAPNSFYEIDAKNIEKTAKEAEMNIKDVLIMLQDLHATREEAEENLVAPFGEMKTFEEAVK